jgi:hypothetical protein
MTETHSNGVPTTTIRRPATGEIDLEQCSRDLTEVRCREAFVLEVAAQMVRRPVRSPLFARCRKTPGHWRCDGSKFTIFAH